ncbi:AraC family ligand binding domain-containing protein [Paenibacillus flagellatus]|uniref:AraC-type arabinose-binding/dimerisation domain-containing protein n=1 Tax=Paenibacillus flagellatus TaxID=2211139 RepID=A0A2V5K5W3_9BACL|nr:AraC family ligand binding domain-containing protein [Paenibacillus flagellatus]PYI53153.1 hypothetical protein DLM86_19390 [Paenibacillus flagellatus]
MANVKERYAPAWTDDSKRLVSAPSPFAKQSLFYVQEIGHFRTLPAYFTERERLDSYLIVFTLDGQGSLTYRGDAYSVSAGQWFWIDCMDYHHYRTHADRLWELLWVHFNGPSAKGYYDCFAEEGR